MTGRAGPGARTPDARPPDARTAGDQALDHRARDELAPGGGAPDPTVPAAADGARWPVPALVWTAVALVVWGGLIAWGRSWGLELLRDGVKILLPTPPVLGEPAPGWRPGLLVPIVVGAALVAALPWLARRLPWRSLLWAVVGLAAAWAVAVALVDGPDGLTRGPSWSTEYGHDVPVVAEDPGGFLRRFPDDIDRYEIHVRGHPPAHVLTLAAMDRVGLRGHGWEAALVIAGGASAAAAVLLAVRDVAGEAVARAAAPVLVLAPAAIWIATSADALFAGTSAWAVTALVLATSSTGRRQVVLAALGGLVASVAVMQSYGMVLVGTIPLAVAVWRRQPRPLLVGAAAAVAGVVAWVPFGFWWFDGLAATRHEYEVLDLDRPRLYFAVNNLAAWGLALGPAVAVALARLRDRRLWLLVGGGVAAVALADASGLSEAEVERIWLPFTVWVLAAGAVLAARAVEQRVWLGAQVVATVAVVTWITTQW